MKTVKYKLEETTMKLSDLKIGLPDKVSGEKTTNGNGEKRGVVNQYEAFLRQTEVIGLLRQLKILPPTTLRDMKGEGKNLLSIPARALLYEWNVSTKNKNLTAGAAQQLNKVFVAGKLPFFAKPGNKKLPKTVLIGRVGRGFEPRFFGIKEGYERRIELGQNKSDGVGGEYELPSEDLVVRVTEWLRELKKFGIDFFSDPVTEKEAGDEIIKLPDGMKEIDKKLYTALENSYLQRYTEEGIRRVNVIIPQQSEKTAVKEQKEGVRVEIENVPVKTEAIVIEPEPVKAEIKVVVTEPVVVEPVKPQKHYDINNNEIGDEVACN
jgi:hypothetical protein